MILTPEQLEQIQQIIKDYHDAFSVAMLGEESVPKEVLDRLKDLGLVDPQFNLIEDAYKYGQLIGKLENKTAVSMSYKAYQDHIKKHPIALTPDERQAVRVATQKVAHHITRLGAQVTSSVTSMAVEADRALRVREIQDTTALNIAKRETVSKLVSDLRWEQNEWGRNWSRVAITEKHTAMQQGLADHYRGKHGKDSLVAKRPMPDACEHCKKHYLDSAGNPKIFKLSELEENGTNVGRKARDWLPVIGGMHPHCLPSNSVIQTVCGKKSIANLIPGDLVFTHQRAWKPVSHVWESLYEGVWVTLNLSDGRTIQATGNHPYLTSNGWVPAQSLHVSDRLLSLPPTSSIVMGANIDSKDDPPMPRQDRLFASVLHGFSRGCVPITAIYFNGEFYLGESEINIDSLNGVIGDSFESSIKQPLVNLAFIGRFELTEFGLRSKKFFFTRMGPASSSFMSILGERFPLFRRHFSKSDLLGLRSSSRNPTNRFDTSNNSSTRTMEFLSNSLYTHQLVEVHVNDFGSVEFNPTRMVRSEFSHSHEETPFDYVDIVNVSLSKIKQKVYNITVEEDHSFVADGIFTHNCLCQLIRVPTGWAFNEEGDLVPESMIEDSEKSLRKSVAYNTTFQGLRVAIESPAGSVRRWRSSDGESGETRIHYDYGYIIGAEGDDGDQLDCYLGPSEQATRVYVIDQQDPETGRYDERKVMLGFLNKEAAQRAYEAHVNRRDMLVSVTPMDLAAFRRWLGPKFQKSSDPDGLSYYVKAQVTKEVGASSSPAANRSPSPGTAANYWFNLPQKRDPGASHILQDQVGYPPMQKELRNEFDQEQIDKIIKESMTREKESFTIREPFPIEPQAWYVPREGWSDRDSDQIKRNRLWLEEIEQSRPVVNRTPVLVDQHIERTPVLIDDNKGDD